MKSYLQHVIMDNNRFCGVVAVKPQSLGSEKICDESPNVMRLEDIYRQENHRN